MNLSPVSSIGRTHPKFLLSRESKKDAGSNPAPDISIKDMKIVDEEKGRVEKVADKIINFYLQMLEIFFPGALDKGEIE